MFSIPRTGDNGRIQEEVPPNQGDEEEGRLLPASELTDHPGDRLDQIVFRGLEVIVPAQVPDRLLQQQVQDILGHCRPEVVGYTTHTPHAVQQFYPLWGVALLGVSVWGFAGGTDFGSGTSRPDAGPYDLPRQIVGLGQVGDTLITCRGIGEANSARKAASAACLNYLTAVRGLEALAQLERAFGRGGPLNQPDAACMQDARARLQAQKMRNYPTFTACLAREFGWIRCQSAGFRDVVLGSVNVLRTVPSMVATVGGGEVFRCVAAPLFKALPHLGGPIGAVSGVASLVQSAFEMVDAHSESQALDLAERHDKRVFALYGADCPELLPLMGYRDDLRQLKRLETRLLKVHSGVRGGYGATSLVTGIATAALLSTGSAVTLGTLGLAGVGAAVGYMGWYAARARLAERASKRYQKGLQTVSANRGDDVARAMRRPGLSAQALRPSLGQIVDDLVRGCTHRGTGQRAREALVALHLPRSVVDAAFDDEAVPLGPCVEPWLGVLQSEFDALHLFLAQKEACAQDKLNALMRLNMNEAHPPRLPGGAGPSWVRHLAPGQHMGDLRRSTLTRDRFLRAWAAPGGLLQDLWQRCPGNTTAHPPRQAADVDGEGAWDALQVWRRSLAQQAQAEAAVAAWVDGGHFAAIRVALNAPDTEERTRARRASLECRFGFSSRDERDPRQHPYAVDEVVATLATRMAQTPLTTDTLAGFMAVWTASQDGAQSALAGPVADLLRRITNPMPEIDREGFCAALNLPAIGPLSVGELKAALPRLQQFLRVSEKLQGQTLTKVVASLHAYPTDSRIPNLVSRAAALRELRQRLEDSQAHPDDVTHALVLARQFATEKLHHRTFGVGEFGSTLGMGGYALNETGQFLREVVERSLGGSPSTARLSESIRPTLIGQEGSALSYWANRLTGMADDALQADANANLLLYRHDEVLAKALGRRETRRNAEAVLTRRREHARQTLGAFVRGFHGQGHAAGLDVDGFIAQLQAFGSLNGLAQRHGMGVLEPPDMGDLKDRARLYLAALEWPHKTGRAKNIRAIRWELDHATTDPQGHRHPRLQLSANRYWSAGFLKSYAEEGRAELERLNAFHEGQHLRYQDAVMSLAALDALSVPALRGHLSSRSEPRLAQARGWIQNQFTAVGLRRRSPVELPLCVQALSQIDGDDQVFLNGVLRQLQQAFEADVLARWEAESRPDENPGDGGDVPVEEDVVT